jgi:hypothetical protein
MYIQYAAIWFSQIPVRGNASDDLSAVPHFVTQLRLCALERLRFSGFLLDGKRGRTQPLQGLFYLVFSAPLVASIIAVVSTGYITSVEDRGRRHVVTSSKRIESRLWPCAAVAQELLPSNSPSQFLW